jgi:hypothetical protein
MTTRYVALSAVVLFFLPSAFSALAQQPSFSVSVMSGQQSSVKGGGTVTGHVVCGDTERAARFAEVMLFEIPTVITTPGKPDAETDPTKAIASIKKTLGASSWVQTETDLEGAFVATGVVPGDYYVLASVPGYIQPSAVLKAANDAGTDMSKPIPGIPRVHVVADRSAQADVSVDRGAAISGLVLWDDGGPVTRATVSLVSAKGKEKPLPPEFALMGLGGGGMLGMTDDQGHFRIAGLAPGDYLIEATVQTNSKISMQSGVMNMHGTGAVSPLVVFAPATFHKSDAKAVTLHTAEDRGDGEVTIRLAGLRSVSGKVTSAEDHHSVNSGTVKLEDATDKDFSRTAGVGMNGEFTVTFVPPGTYNLTVSEAADTEPSKGGSLGPLKIAMDHTVKSYQAAKQTVVVGENDVTEVNVEVTPDATVKKDLDLEELMKQGGDEK